MRSPFAIFRKYQKVAMVIVLVMIMIAFTLGDALGQMSGNLPPIYVALLAAMAGASLAALVGVQAGKPYHYSIGGAIIGAVVGFFLVPTPTDEVVVSTAMGQLTREEVQERMRAKNAANNVVEAAFRAGFPLQDENPFMAQMWGQQLQRYTFGPANQDNIVLGYLMQIEADRLGIYLSDEAVNHYLNVDVANNKMTKADFRKIRDRVRMSETEIFDILRQELRAKHARLALMPPALETPEEYWEIYRRLNVTQRLDLAPVPVAAFVAEIADPAKEDLMAFFDKYKDVFPGQTGFADPGLRQPRKIRVGYFEVDFTEVETQVTAVSDEDIETYYKENRERFRDNRPTGSTPTGPIKAPLPGQPNAELPEVKFPTAADTEKTEPAAETPDADQPEKATPDAETPEATTPEGDKPAAENEETSSIEKQSDLAIADDLLALADTGLLIAQADPADAEKAAPAGDTPAESRDSETTPESDSAGTDPESVIVTPAAGAGNDDIDFDLPEPKYRELDDDLRGTIRDIILNDRTFEKMQEISLAARAAMSDIRNEYANAIAGGLPKPKIEDVTAKMQAYAEGKPVKYVVTDPLSYTELIDTDKNPVGTAIEQSSANSQQGATTVANLLFNTGARQIFQEFIAEDFNTKNQFVFWKLDDQPDRIPELEDPGVKEQAIAAWKQQQAIPLAKARAEELAKQARESDKPFAEALGAAHVTTKDDSETITTQLTGPFTWMETSSAPSGNPFAQRSSPPRISPVIGVEQAGFKFMETVFDELENGAIGVVPNADETVYYVVQVTDREPSTPADQQAMRERFLKENLFEGNAMFGQQTPYQFIFNETQRRLQSEWMEATMSKYQVQTRTSRENEADLEGEAP